MVEGDLAPPTEGSHDRHATKQEEEEEEEDEGGYIRVSLIPFYIAASILPTHITQGEIHSDEEMEEGGGKGEGEEEGELVAVK